MFAVDLFLLQINLYSNVKLYLGKWVLMGISALERM
jgi:hypothetical protein